MRIKHEVMLFTLETQSSEKLSLNGVLWSIETRSRCVSSDSHVDKQHKSLKRDTRSLQVSYDHRSYERKLNNCI